jgi:hypothetical protein
MVATASQAIRQHVGGSKTRPHYYYSTTVPKDGSHNVYGGEARLRCFSALISPFGRNYLDIQGINARTGSAAVYYPIHLTFSPGPLLRLIYDCDPVS